MTVATKVDNGNLRAKLELRRYLLRKFNASEPIHVMDCCAGKGVLWGRLRQEFEIASYWAMDRKPKKVRLALDSARVLSQPGWSQNVIDVDTYGSPWRHWTGILANLARPTTVFLTIGQWQMGTDHRLLESLGLAGLKIPPGIAVKLKSFALSYVLTRGCDAAITIVEAVEAVSRGSARYLGIRLNK